MILHIFTILDIKISDVFVNSLAATSSKGLLLEQYSQL